MSSITFLAGFFALEIISGISGQVAITCETQANNRQFFIKRITTVQCPDGCASAVRGVFGTKQYTAFSDVCTAAIHDGRIGSQGGFVKVKRLLKRPFMFIASTANGITTIGYYYQEDAFEFIDLYTTAATVTTAMAKGVNSSTTEKGAHTEKNSAEGRDSVNRSLAIVFGVLFAITLLARV